MRNFLGAFFSLKANLRVKHNGTLSHVLMYLLPSALLLVAATCYYGFSTSFEYVEKAIERNVTMRGAVISRTVETFIENSLRELYSLSSRPIKKEQVFNFIETQARISPGRYKAAFFVPEKHDQGFLAVETDGEVHVFSSRLFLQNRINQNLLSDLSAFSSFEGGRVASIRKLVFPDRQDGNIYRETTCLTLLAPATLEGGVKGHLFLIVDAQYLRGVLAQSTTSDNNAWGFARSNALRFSYLVDPEGWIIMQSVHDQKEDGLPTYLARAGLLGTLGKEGHPSAFLPDQQHQGYWQVVRSLQEGQSGLEVKRENGFLGFFSFSNYYLTYQPVYIKPLEGGKPILLYGLVYIDRSKLAYHAATSFMQGGIFWAGGAFLLILLVVVLLHKLIIVPLRLLGDALEEKTSSQDRTPVSFSGFSTELVGITDSANMLLKVLTDCEGRLDTIAQDPMSDDMKQPEDLEAEYQNEVCNNKQDLGMIGRSSAMASLREEISKAAETSADVFIVGETGTGKQLVAEAIHGQSSRKNESFVAINCGALNENLLLDALFGHVKGAYSEAKHSRNGAFMEANGGTLFLDEIQAASANVQQALLRAIAERKIRPLGSDQEFTVDVRLITATNCDLPELISEGTFREDLFYRLHVLTLQTIPLRLHKEDIPLLAYHYLQEARELVGKKHLQFSKGALKVLLNHAWPGNVRELINCVTRSAVFAEGPVIQATDLRMEDSALYNTLPESTHVLQATKRQHEDSEPFHEEAAVDEERDSLFEKDCDSDDATHFSARQLLGLEYLIEHKTITRKDYQRVVGGALSPRTANYDLNDLIKKGVLVREGMGAGTSYRLSESFDAEKGYN